MKMNYDYILEIIEHFNKDEDLYPFVLSGVENNKWIQNNKLHFTDVESLIKDGEVTKNLKYTQIQASDRNKFWGFNDGDMMEIRRDIDLVNGILSSMDMNTFGTTRKNFIKKKQKETQDYLDLWRSDKKAFEEFYFMMLHFLSGNHLKNDEKDVSDTKIVSSWTFLLLSTKQNGQNFIKKFAEKEWTSEQFIFLQKNYINPLILANFLDTPEYISFVEAFEKHYIRLNGDKKDDFYLDKTKNFDRIALSYLQYAHQQNYFSQLYNPVAELSDKVEREVFFIHEGNVINNNLSYALSKKWIAQVESMKDVKKSLQIKGVIGKRTNNKKLSSELYIDIMQDVREYKNFVFNVPMKATNFRNILTAFEKLNNILIEKTNLKISLENYSDNQGQVFVFKADKRCYKNEGDFAVYLQDLIMDMFSLDIKTCVKQIEDTNNIPVLNDLIKYVDKCFEYHKQKANGVNVFNENINNEDEKNKEVFEERTEKRKNTP